MGSEIYYHDRNLKIKALEQRRDQLYHDALFKPSISDRLNSWDEKFKVDDEIKRLKLMDEKEKKFEKNINLDDYKNSDGTFNIYKTKRSLNVKGGETSQKLIKKILIKISFKISY